MQQTRYEVRVRRQRGAAMLLALVAIAVASLLAAAIAALIVSHNSHTRTDQDALKALNAADAALNYQTQRIFATTGIAPVAYNGSNVESATYGLQANPLPVTAKTYNSTASTLNSFLGLTVTATAATTDYCRCWIEYPGSPTMGLDLTSSNQLYVYGEARINGTWRRVRAKAGATGLFNKWAIFTNGTLTVGGSLSVTPLTGTSVGYVGSNTSIDINKDDGAVGGQVIYGSGVPDSGFPYAYGGKAVELPSIDELASAAYLAGSYTTTASTGIAKFGVANDNTALGTFAKKNGGGNATNAMPTNGVMSNQDSYPIKLQGKTQVSGQPQKVANYYLPRLDGSGVTIWADVSKGPVNLWINNTSSGNTANDSLQGNIDIVAYSTWDNANSRPLQTLADAKKFHIYYNNPNGSLTITGGGSVGNIYAMIYAYNVSNGTPSGTINVAGGVTVNGAVYTQTLSGTGNFQVNYPSSVSVSDGAGILFGVNTPWQEVTPVRGN